MGHMYGDFRFQSLDHYLFEFLMCLEKLVFGGDRLLRSLLCFHIGLPRPIRTNVYNIPQEENGQ